ncbi:universal stress protein [Saccharicrinis fermentans]|uniref:Universal stress protein UspG n=1 Tax=Saccharicrinis fermentans DSM 9555 = JCM 21142 TaxID=869213 RepID=W7XVY4_9BACT|nr:universal stress protein [Saccharicrinis fermentans]GAF02410.1 universal stress protein UspG [Saccharicrinis fermentans DSM 9555 = JCM 21142]
MENSENIILVPYDFTEVAMHAVDHAKSISSKNNIKICLLHIVKKDSDIEPSLQKLNEETALIKDKYNIETQGIVREGTIFKTINEVAQEMNAIMVIMGTHGIRGMQKLTGSWALKVIVGSKIPFFVVQEKPIDCEVKKIVFPVDFKTENKEKLYWAEFISKLVNT